MLLKISHENIRAGVSFLISATGLKKLQHRCFLVKFAKFFKIFFWGNTYKRLFRFLGTASQGKFIQSACYYFLLLLLFFTETMKRHGPNYIYLLIGFV